MRAIIFDTETTGLLKHESARLDEQPRIIEIGAIKVDLDSGEIIDQLDQLLNPEMVISPEITKITSITNEMLVGQPTFADFYDKLVQFFDGTDVLICHNASFDTGMLKVEVKRLKRDFPFPKRVLCTVEQYHHEFGHRPKLTQLYEKKVGKPLMQKHRAVGDCEALYEALSADGFFKCIN